MKYICDFPAFRFHTDISLKKNEVLLFQRTVVALLVVLLTQRTMPTSNLRLPLAAVSKNFVVLNSAILVSGGFSGKKDFLWLKIDRLQHWEKNCSLSGYTGATC